MNLRLFVKYVLLFSENNWVASARYSYNRIADILKQETEDEKNIMVMDVYDIPLETINKSTVQQLVLDSVLPILAENQFDVYDSLGYDIVAESSTKRVNFPSEVYKDRHHDGMHSLIQHADRLEYNNWVGRRNEIEFLLTQKNSMYPKRCIQILRESLRANFVHPRERFRNLLDTNPLSGMIKRSLAPSKESLKLDSDNRIFDGQLIDAYLKEKGLFSNLNLVLFVSGSKMDVYIGDENETNTDSSSKKTDNYSLQEIEDFPRSTKSEENQNGQIFNAFRNRPSWFI